MKNRITSFVAAGVICPAGLASAATIITPNTPTSNVAPNAGSSLAGLVNGTGLSATVNTGSDTAAALGVTHSSGAIANDYVTAASVPDYFTLGAPPVLTFTLGSTFSDVESIIVWNYTQGTGSSNASNNSTQTFNLEFFSDAGATASLGTVTGLTLVRSVVGTQVAQQLFFGAGVNFDGVQSIKMTLTDNHFGQAGGAGGDRVGLAEVRFSQVPEPSAALLGGLGLLAILRRRRN